jgi:hypothetical protein
VAVFGGTTTGNEVSRNSIFSNGGLGIDLNGPGEDSSTNVSTPNDAGDADSGANNLQNKPVLSSAKTISGKTTIKGKLDSNPNQTYTIEFYSNPADTNEGKKLIGETSITTSVDGLRSFTFSPTTSVPVGQTITATATRASTHDTSEFSAPRAARLKRSTSLWHDSRLDTTGQEEESFRRHARSQTTTDHAHAYSTRNLTAS